MANSIQKFLFMTYFICLLTLINITSNFNIKSNFNNTSNFSKNKITSTPFKIPRKTRKSYNRYSKKDFNDHNNNKFEFSYIENNETKRRAAANALTKKSYDSIDLNEPYDLVIFPYTGSLKDNDDSVNDFRLLLDYTNTKNLTKEQNYFLRVFIIPPALERIANLVRIKKRETLRFDRSDPLFTFCEDEFISIPKFYTQKAIKADILILINATKLEDDTFAMSSPCYVSKLTGRTLIGSLIYNSKFLDLKMTPLIDAVETVQHELVHTLVFDPLSFNSFTKNYKKQSAYYKGQEGVYFLRGNSMLRQARNYFKCNNIL